MDEGIVLMPWALWWVVTRSEGGGGEFVQHGYDTLGRFIEDAAFPTNSPSSSQLVKMIIPVQKPSSPSFSVFRAVNPFSALR